MTNQNLTFRQLTEQEQKPYELLLLADPSIEIIDEYLKLSQIFIAEQNKIVFGTTVLQNLGNKICEIKNVSVKEELQGQGIGKYLIENVTDFARKMNFRTIQIGTANSSVRQLYLYQKLGFEITEIKRNFFIDNYIDKIYENGIQAKHMIMLSKAL